MRTSTLVWIVVIILIVGGGAWYYMSMQSSPAAAPGTTDTGAAGVNGSPNQGNLGQPTPASTGSGQAGVVQQPGADGAVGSIIGANVALGTSADAKLGTYLVAYNGMTLYTYSKDTGSTSTCYGQCATNWPPYVVGPEDNLAQLKAGVTGKVDTTTRTDGKLQVTYKGHPLYFYVKDAKSGDTTGQNVGGVWFVVKP